MKLTPPLVLWSEVLFDCEAQSLCTHTLVLGQHDIGMNALAVMHLSSTTVGAFKHPFPTYEPFSRRCLDVFLCHFFHAPAAFAAAAFLRLFLRNWHEKNE